MAEWWQDAVIYHIYPRSFMDATGDGVGDLPGITQRLDYLDWLGIDAVWISPVYPSPMADFGYDITDHKAIHPMFGTLADMDTLIAEAHKRNIRVILDFVPNHTSNAHPWFIESRSSRDNPRRNWYYWKDPAPGGGPPNNWLSRFDGKSAWEWDEGTQQYYLHTFLVEQPDLNWRNPAVRDAMLDILRFWFDRGVDGFRVDVAYRVMKDRDFRDNPINPDWREGMDRSFRVIERNTKNTPDIHQFNRWIRQTADAYDDRVTVGEMNLPIPELVKHYGTPGMPEFHLPFNFRLIFSPWEAANVRALADQYDAAMPAHGWPNWVLSNHDQPRFATRAGVEQARCGMLFLLTMRGTPTIYYGDELGMQNVPIPPEKVQDPWELLSPGLGLGRDPVRTPMRWDTSPTAGFCPVDVEPWLPVGADGALVNVETQQGNPTSILRFTRALIHLRRRSPALLHGDYRNLPAPDDVFAYARVLADEQFVVVLNFSAAVQRWPLPPDWADLRVALSTRVDDTTRVIDGAVTLRPNEGVLLQRV
ncbi:MAG: alpha-amylase family glycosyl hydrolase [Chloroflexota bacterium]